MVTQEHSLLQPASVNSVSKNSERSGPKPSVTVYYGTFVDTPTLGEVRIRYKTSVGVDSRGCILFIKEKSLDPVNDALEYNKELKNSEIKVVDGMCEKEYSKFFFPGFIDTHIHASQYPNAGIFGNSTLMDWLNKYTFPLEESLKHLDVAEVLYKKVVERTLSNGTTTAAYYTTIDPRSSMMMATICSKLGQRALVGKVCMDMNGPDYYLETTEQSLKSCESVVDYILNDLKDPKVLPILTPRFAPTCSTDLMLGLSDLSQAYNHLHIQTHLSENFKEISLVKSLFPEYSSYTDVYNKCGLLTERSVMAHCVHLSQDEMKLIKNSNSGVSHCPISNSSLTSGECPVRTLLKQGIKVGLGTDVSGGFSCSILETARHAHLVSRHLAMKCDDKLQREQTKLSVEEALYLGTMGGARVLDMSSSIGSFEVGKKFDTQLIDLNAKGSKVDVFDWQIPSDNTTYDLNDILCKWFFNGDDRNLTGLWVEGVAIL